MDKAAEVIKRFITLNLEISELHIVETQMFKQLYTLAIGDQKDKFEAELNYLYILAEFHETGHELLKYNAEKVEGIIKPIMDLFLASTKKLPVNLQATQGFDTLIANLDKRIEMIKNLRNALLEKLGQLSTGGRFLN